MALNIKERIKRAAGRGGNEDESVDQLEARKERARQEARREAAAEARQEEVERARAEAFEEKREQGVGEPDQPGALSRVASVVGNAVDAVDDGDNEFMDDFETAMQTDFDGDGDPFAAELGLQSDREAEQVEEFTGSIANQVNENTAGISMLEEQVDRGPPAQSGGRAQQDVGGIFGDGGGDMTSEATDQADEFWGL